MTNKPSMVIILSVLLVLMSLLPIGCSKTGAWQTKQINAKTKFRYRSVDISTHVNLNSVSVIDTGYGWIVGDHDTTYVHENGKWTKVDGLKKILPRGSDFSLESAVVLNSNDVWISGGRATVPNKPFSKELGLIVQYKNHKYSQINPPYPTILYNMEMVNRDSGWASGGNLIMSFNGRTWQSDDVPQNGVIWALAMKNQDEGWAVGVDLLHYSNGTWIKDPNQLPAGMRSLLLLPDNTLLVGGYHALSVLKSGVLDSIGGFEGKTINSMALGPDNLVVLVGADTNSDTGKIMFLSNYKKLPVEVTNPLGLKEPQVEPHMSEQLTDIAFDARNHGWIVGWDGTLIEFYIDPRK